MVENAERVARWVATLPVGEMKLVPADRLGRGMAGILRAELEETGGARVDLVSGTKAQVAALAALEELEPWVLGTPMLDGREGLEVRQPSVPTVASVVGGELLGRELPNLADAVDQDRCRFFALLLELQACWIGSSPRWRLDRWTAKRCAHGSVEVSPAASRSRVRLSVRHHGTALDGEVPEEGGGWLEEAVAASFLAMGAEDVRCNVQWQFPLEIARARLSRDLVRQGWEPLEAKAFVEAIDPAAPLNEIDVAARFAERFVSVECKATRYVDAAHERRLVEAKTLRGFGPLAVPVLVVPSRSFLGISETERLGFGIRALVLDLADLGRPKDVLALLRGEMGKRSSYV